jgi:putative intracellular protease/amidase
MPKTSRPRQALFLTADQFEDFELFVPYFRLLEGGWEGNPYPHGKAFSAKTPRGKRMTKRSQQQPRQ